MQASQDVMADEFWYLPILQTLHTVSRATSDDDLPTAHLTQATLSNLLLNLPGMHSRQAVIPTVG